MEKMFKLPLLVLLWTVVIVMIVFAILFIYGMILGFTDPGVYF